MVLWTPLRSLAAALKAPFCCTPVSDGRAEFTEAAAVKRLKAKLKGFSWFFHFDSEIIFNSIKLIFPSWTLFIVMLIVWLGDLQGAADTREHSL